MDHRNKDLAQKVLTYYNTHRRILPWREDPRPYYVWLSEIMLQQTRVETVIPYFNRFIETFPTVRDLAEGSEEVLLKLWEGLGYYSRARNLQKAAGILMEQYEGKLPSTKVQLIALPGIGPYTAGAIASIAFGKKETAIDGNLLRVGSRLLAFGGVVTKGEGKKKIEEFWQEVLPEDRPGDFNQAIMDIGATICLPNRDPLCQSCPLSSLCKAYEQGNSVDYPQKEEKKPRKMQEKTVFLLYDADNIALQKRNDKGLLAGLWQFPMAEGHLDEEQAIRWLSQNSLQALRLGQGPSAKHIFSHIEWRMICWVVKIDPFRVREKAPEDFVWMTKEEVDTIALPTAFRKFRQEIRNKRRI